MDMRAKAAICNLPSLSQSASESGVAQPKNSCEAKL
jgi:hypothetical protein